MQHFLSTAPLLPIPSFLRRGSVSCACVCVCLMSYVSRNHYLLLHDALRKMLGPSAQLAAFVKAKKPFQCDLVVNSKRTDPLTLAQVGAAVGSPGGRAKDEAGVALEGVKVFARELQELLGSCDIIPHTRRLDIVFRDRAMLQVALGPDKADMPFAVDGGADLNQMPDWRERNRMRISLGFDEELFAAECTRSVNVAARLLERKMYDQCRRSSILLLNSKMAAAFEACGRDWLAVTPPVSYWKVHGYGLDKAYGCRHYQNIAATVERNFAEYYGVFPLENPYCPGEDLNTIEVAQWLCEGVRTGAVLHRRREGVEEEEDVVVVAGTLGAPDMAETEAHTDKRM